MDACLVSQHVFSVLASDAILTCITIDYLESEQLVLVVTGLGVEVRHDSFSLVLGDQEAYCHVRDLVVRLYGRAHSLCDKKVGRRCDGLDTHSLRVDT